MATLNEGNRKNSVSPESDIADLETLEEYGVWVKSGPDDIGESGFDEEFEISDLNGTADDDLLTEEEEELLSDFEDHVEEEVLPEMDLQEDGSNLFEVELPDFSSEESETPGDLDDLDSFDMNLPVAEELSSAGNEPAQETEEKDFESVSFDDLPELDVDSLEEPESGADETAEESLDISSEFSEISLDAFGDDEADTGTPRQPVVENTQEEDFLDLDFDEDALSNEEDTDLFTTEELDDFFGVPVDEVQPDAPEEPGKHENHEDESYFDTVPVPETKPVMQDGSDSIDFPELGSLDDIELDSMSFASIESETQDQENENLEPEEDLPELVAEDFESTVEVASEDLMPESDLESIELTDVELGPDALEVDLSDLEPESASLELDLSDLEPEPLTEAAPEPESEPEVLDSISTGIEGVETRIQDAREKESLETSLLLQIERELASIKAELSGLKQELSTLRQSAGPGDKNQAEGGESEEKVSGFFDEDEDETIALTGDELDNILNTANITEETGEEENVSESLIALPPESAEIGEPVPSDEDLIELEDRVIQNAAPSLPPESADEILGPVLEEELPEEGITLIEVSEDESEIDSLFDNKPESLTITDQDEAAGEENDSLPVFEEINEEDMVSGFGFEETAADDELYEQDGETIQEEDFSALESLNGIEIESEEDSETSVFIPDEEVTIEEVRNSDFALETDTESRETVEPDSEASSAETMKGSAAGESTALQGSLRDEIKSVLSYMDTLLEALPEAKIEEFARSEHFDVYRKLFEELGLGK